MKDWIRITLIFAVLFVGVTLEVLGGAILWGIHPALTVLWMAFMTMAVFAGEFLLTLY